MPTRRGAGRARGPGRPPLPCRRCAARSSSEPGRSGRRSPGGWPATGAEVTLVDQFEPGDARATSGGESRLIRCGHGPDAFYTASARRARTLWRELEAECGEELLVECGLVWFAHAEDGFEARDHGHVRRAGDPVRAARARGGRARCTRASTPPASRSCCTSPRRACCARSGRSQALARQAAAHGATVLRAARGARRRAGAPRRRPHAGGRRRGLGVRPVARRPVPRALPIRSTRQELFFFDGGPAWARGRRARLRRLRPGDLRHARPRRPRRQGGAGLRRPAARPRRRAARRDAARASALARAFLAERFPALADAPLSGSKCCRYELTPDAHFVAAPHPGAPVRLAARRRLGPRLQARPRDGRARRRGARGRRAAARDLRARRPRRRRPPAHRWRDGARRRRVGAMHDYLIVGAGSAGCALAARLTEDPDVSVLLVEAGPPDSEEALHIPVAFSKLYRTPFDWDYSSGPEPALDGRELYVPRGPGARRLLVAQRDDLHPRQPARLRRVGPGLGLGRRAPVLPARRGQRARRERAARRRRPAERERRALERTCSPPPGCRRRSTPACRPTTTSTAPAQDGVGHYQLTQRGGMRCSAAVAYLHPALARPNLTLMPGALVTRVLVRGRARDRRGGRRSTASRSPCAPSAR